MKRRYIFLLLVSAVALFCAATVNAQTKEKWKQYTSKYYGISFHLPPDWTPDWDENTKVFTALSANEDLALVFRALKDETLGARDLWDAAAGEIVGEGFKLEGKVEEHKNLGGLHAWVGIGHGLVNDVYGVIAILAAFNPVKDDNIVVYMFADPNAADESDIGTMVSVLQSFRVAKGK